MPSVITITLIHNGTPNEGRDFSRSYIKENLSLLNHHVSSPVTDDDVDGYNPARLTKAVSIIHQAIYENSATSFDRRSAANAADFEVQQRGRQTTIGNL